MLDAPYFRSLTEAGILCFGTASCLPAQQIDQRKILFGRIATAAVPEHRFRPKAETMPDMGNMAPAALIKKTCTCYGLQLSRIRFL